MRLDKFLKVTRIIKRRTIANELCDLGRVKVNGDVKKALYSVKDGDKLEIRYFNRIFNVYFLKLPPESLKKDDISMYINISEQKEEN